MCPRGRRTKRGRDRMHRDTRLVHYGRGTGASPANPPVVRASTILHETVESYRDTKARREHDDGVLSYGRRGTTTAHVLAAAVADLEGAPAAYLFPSGLAAIAGAISPFVSAGDHLLVVDTVFPATRTFCEKVLRGRGVSIDYFPWNATDLADRIRPTTTALVVESPASQTYEVMDLPAIRAQAPGLTIIADNTYGSSILYRPLALGCDVSVIAGTKYLCGHADVMMGVVCATGEAVAPLREQVHATGQTLSPDDAYGCLRGMRTLGLRMERHASTGRALASWFGARDEAERVFHPGLVSNPGHDVWVRDAEGDNGLLTVAFRDGFPVDQLLAELSLFSVGSSWGGFESLALPVDPAGGRALAYDYPSGPMVRFHAGLEHVEDLLEDLGLAMSSVLADR